MAVSPIAQTIASQIGSRAFFMVGTKQRIADGDALIFDVCRNQKKVRYVKVALNGLDLYDIEFYRIKRGSYEKVVLSEESNVYAEDLHRVISSHTGLALSL